MASSKKRRKQDSVNRRLDGGKPASAKDGDRRHKTSGRLSRDILRRKQSLRDWTIDDGPPADD